MKIAVITYDARGSYADAAVQDEDELLSKILEGEQVEFKFEVWSDKSVDWRQYSHILVKSPWDYFDRYTEFLNWCHMIQTLRIPVFNDLETIIWNSDKRYLMAIQKQGFPIVPTRFFSKNEVLDLEACFEAFHTDHLIFKPTVSGGAKNTLKIDRGDDDGVRDKLQVLLKQADFMVQPFLNEVVKEGEYSYVFFNREFSHAVLKSPKKGEFRVQHFFGGHISTVKPIAKELKYLQKLVDAFARDTLYARVDGIWIEGVFYLMELELIEPYLFLFTDGSAIGNYTKAIKARLGL